MHFCYFGLRRSCNVNEMCVITSSQRIYEASLGRSLCCCGWYSCAFILACFDVELSCHGLLEAALGRSGEWATRPKLRLLVHNTKMSILREIWNHDCVLYGSKDMTIRFDRIVILLQYCSCNVNVILHHSPDEMASHSWFSQRAEVYRLNYRATIGSVLGLRGRFLSVHCGIPTQHTSSYNWKDIRSKRVPETSRELVTSSSWRIHMQACENHINVLQPSVILPFVSYKLRFYSLRSPVCGLQIKETWLYTWSKSYRFLWNP